MKKSRSGWNCEVGKKFQNRIDKYEQMFYSCRYKKERLFLGKGD